MTRLGKIARLPREIREQLNIRLRNGEEGGQLVQWMNGLAEVQVILGAKFGGRPINPQNLSEWKKGGYEDWLLHQEDCSHARLLTENADELEKEAGEICLEDRLAAPMAIALVRLLREAAESSDGAEKQKAILNVARELARLRHGSHDAERVRLERERWETQQANAAEKKRKEEEIAAYAERLRAQFPELYRHSLQAQSGMMPQDVQVCLEANTRLRTQSQVGESEKQALAENVST